MMKNRAPPALHPAVDIDMSGFFFSVDAGHGKVAFGKDLEVSRARFYGRSAYHRVGQHA
jgi:hypothetical protein